MVVSAMSLHEYRTSTHSAVPRKYEAIHEQRCHDTNDDHDRTNPGKSYMPCLALF